MNDGDFPNAMFSPRTGKTTIIVVSIVCATVLFASILITLIVLLVNQSQEKSASRLYAPIPMPQALGAYPANHAYSGYSGNHLPTPQHALLPSPFAPGPVGYGSGFENPTLGGGLSLNLPTPMLKPVQLENMMVTRNGSATTMNVHLKIPYTAIAVPGQPHSMHQQSTGYTLQKHLDVALHSGRIEQYLSYHATRLLVLDVKFKWVDTFNCEFDLYLTLNDGTTSQDLEMPLLMGLQAVLQFIGYDFSYRRFDSLRVAPMGQQMIYSNVARKQDINLPPVPDAYNFEYQANLRRRGYEEPRVTIDRYGITVNSVDPSKYSRMTPHALTSAEINTYDPYR